MSAATPYDALNQLDLTFMAALYGRSAIGRLSLVDGYPIEVVADSPQPTQVEGRC